MMSVVSAFERHYVKAENSDLNLRTRMFSGQAVAIVMESFQQYYRLIEQAALKMQAEEEKEQVSDENDSSVLTLGSPPELTEPLEKAHKASKSTSKKSKDNETYTGKKISKEIKKFQIFSWKYKFHKLVR